MTVNLWELVLKLRSGEVYCRAVLKANCVAKMRSVVSAEHWGGWSTKCATNGNSWPFIIAFDRTEKALVHELCRYRSG